MDQNALIRIVLFSLALLLSAGCLAGSEFSSLEERMTAREFRDAGLHKLTDEELAILNRWIKARSLAEGEAMSLSGRLDPAEDRRGFDGGDRSPIRSRIVGPFTGWRGQTVFELENGQVWRQSESGTFAIGEVENPSVEISPGMFGSWRLRVDGYNSRVRVERIR
jgi:hypothetical protein